MRKRVVWGTYCLSLLAGLLALGWLSLESMRLDRGRELALQETERARIAEFQAKQQIDLQDRISRAVWLLDSMLTPLVAQEATRPADVYQPFLWREVFSKGGPQGETTQEPSPLLNVPSQFVVLHFQIDCNDQWSSPQVPEGEQLKLAMTRGLIEESYASASTALQSLREQSDYETLAAQLPQDRIENFENWQQASNGFDYNGSARANQDNQAYAYGRDSLQQLNRQQQAEFSGGLGTANIPGQRQQSVSPRQSPAAQSESAPQQSALEDLSQRNRILETFANNSLVSQQLGLNQGVFGDGEVRFGVTRPLWLNGRLILARQSLLSSGEISVQGCWLNWEKLQQRMKEDVAELLPVVEFEPVVSDTQLRPTHLLATLPVQLSVPMSSGEPLPSAKFGQASVQRPILATLSAAWIGFIVAAVAGGGLLFNAERLSERRAQFVSSVTHELRTPLTTFRMYTEMLSSGMITNAKDQSEYLATLQVEADRLTHLVENVLAYSRLEHGGKKAPRVRVSVVELSERLAPRLERRVAQMGRRLEVQLQLPLQRFLETDLIAVEQILANLVDNACKYGHRDTEVPFLLQIKEGRGGILFRVCDHGPGVPMHKREAIFYPFRKSDVEAAQTAPGIGLGLALSRRLANDLGGTLRLDCDWNDGACFEFFHPSP